MFRGHDRQYRDIAEAVRTGRSPGVGIADATLALATVHAVYEAARTGQAVQVADVLDGRLVLPSSGWRMPAAAQG
jgi:predicted dehydrogenase